ncbi:MAG: YraN family protein [Verrucomicrobiota bacterium]|jgi:putative endonuclease|nr:YraN family protein [Verrucomicrobiota bacterium]MDP7048268.1 YraN family protein [Verrucomicrobiota bacterium]
MRLWWKLQQALGLQRGPEHLRRGRVGEAAAKRHLQRAGLKFLTANFQTKDSEIDLVFRDGDCLVFVEVKARTEGGWTRPAAAVNRRKRGRLGQAAKEYLKRLGNLETKFRFDIVEVLLRDGEVIDVRHLPNAFPLTRPER